MANEKFLRAVQQERDFRTIIERDYNKFRERFLLLSPDDSFWSGQREEEVLEDAYELEEGEEVSSQHSDSDHSGGQYRDGEGTLRIGPGEWRNK